MSSTSATSADKPTKSVLIDRRILPLQNHFSTYTIAALLALLLIVLSGVVLRLSGYVGGAYSWFLFSRAGDDSWFPMGLAYERVMGQAPGSLHDLFFVDKIKFQYPSSSLFLYSVLDSVGLPTTPAALNVLVWFSILITALAIFQLTRVYILRNQAQLPFANLDRYAISLAFGVATLFFYPIMISWRLGQVQGILNMLFALACLCWLKDRKLFAGALVGAICLVKPQFSLFMIWALLRRETSFTVGQLGVVILGTALSLAMFGWTDVVFYLDVLSYISKHGEVFWDNTTINGLINGLIQPHETLIWRYHEFPPFHVVTYGSTIISSILIAGVALFWRRRAEPSLLDFTLAAFSFTLASPIAWGHHFGVAMPVFVIAFLEIARRRAAFKSWYLLIFWGLCFLLFAVNWNFTQRFAETDFALLQYWRIYAAFGFLLVAYRLAKLQDAASDTWSGEPRQVQEEFSSGGQR